MPMTCDGLDESDGGWTSPYLRNEPRILRDVCRSMRRDDGGRRCPACGLREFCESQAARADGLAAEAAA